MSCFPKVRKKEIFTHFKPATFQVSLPEIQFLSNFNVKWQKDVCRKFNHFYHSQISNYFLRSSRMTLQPTCTHATHDQTTRDIFDGEWTNR